jgi:hypothetical protein
LKRIIIAAVLCIILSGNLINAQKAKFGINFTYDLYTNLDQVDGVKSSWRTLYTYNSSAYYYDLSYRYWPYDQLNMDISMQLGNKVLAIEPFFSFTIIKGWYGVSYNDGKYVSDAAILYLPESADHPAYIDGDEFLYGRGSGRMGQNRIGANLILGDEIQIGTGIWWQKQKIELYKSMAFNRYWYNMIYARPGVDAFVTYEDDFYVNEPSVETVFKKRFLFPVILRYKNGPFSSHFTFIFQKPIQVLMGGGLYF